MPATVSYHRYKVRSTRNSQCSYPIEELNWSRWWTDSTSPSWDFYLHVEALDGDTVQRVYCRKSDHARIAMHDGELFWLVDNYESKAELP